MKANRVLIKRAISIASNQAYQQADALYIDALTHIHGINEEEDPTRFAITVAALGSAHDAVVSVIDAHCQLHATGVLEFYIGQQMDAGKEVQEP